MWWRLAFPLVFMFGPRLIPRLVRTVYLAWKLTFDRRVPLLLKLLVPGALVLLPWFLRFPYIGLPGYVLVVALAVLILLNLSPRYVVESHAPWRASGGTGRARSDKEGPRVVEGTYHVLEEEDPGE